MNTAVIHDVMAETQAGSLVLSEVARRLLEAAVEGALSILSPAMHIEKFPRANS